MADSPVKLEAHGATHHAHDTRSGALRQRPASRAEPGPGEAAPGADPFRLGFRYRLGTTADGQESVEQVPLSPEDLLYPQEGDVVSDGFAHGWGLQPTADSIRRHHMQRHPDTLVTSNIVLVLRSDGKNCSPDVAVIEGGIDFSEIERAVHLRDTGGRLVFALEVVSTSEKEIEEKDTLGNVDRYAAEKVAEYFTVYPIVERQVKDLVGRRLVAPKGRERNAEGGYVEIPADAQGRVYSKELDLFFQIDAASKELVAIDAQTGQRLLISDEEEAGRKKAEAERDVAEVQRDAAQTQRDAAQAQRDAAQAQRQQEAEARGQAEQCLRRHVEDLCGLLGIEWTAERSTAVRGMGTAQLEALWADLMSQKRWP